MLLYLKAGTCGTMSALNSGWIANPSVQGGATRGRIGNPSYTQTSNSAHESKMNPKEFDELHRVLDGGGVPAVLGKLEQIFRREKSFHQLFEVLKMKVRYRLDLPLQYNDLGDDLNEAQREALEVGLIDACRDVGQALIEEGHVRDAWMYLRPVGDKSAMAKVLDRVPVNDENRDEVIEVALHEGIDVERGYRLVLEHYGTCNAITTLHQYAHGRQRDTIQGPAGLLVQHVYEELVQSVRSHIQREEGQIPNETTLLDLIKDREWLFGEYSYHLDASHLASTVQAARCLDTPALLQLACEMTDYGKRLNAQFQYPGEEPFVDMYPSHRLYFGALLGENQVKALQYFHHRAQQLDAYQHGTTAAEVYIDLLSRLGRFQEAIQATIELIPDNTHTTGLAPDLLQLAQQAGEYEKVLDVYRERTNLLGYATGLMQSMLNREGA